MKKIGEIELYHKCDITDPCYNKDVWCRHTVENIKPGKYNCYVEETYSKDWGRQISGSWIIHEDYDTACHPEYMSELDRDEDYEVGVDAGLFGYFDDKPDMTDDEWNRFCDNIKEHPVAQISKFRGRDGFYTSSGYGDGGYPVLTYSANDKIVAIAAIFIR